jgi:hypothetical protein
MTKKRTPIFEGEHMGLTEEQNRIFWDSFTDDQIRELFDTGCLPESKKQLLYRLRGFQNVPEGQIQMMVSLEAVLELLPEKDRAKARAKYKR